MAEMAGARPRDVICFGHTHKPWHREVAGRPKDGDWRAGYVTLDLDGDAPAAAFVRVEYDLEAAMREIRRSDLPDAFAEYLAAGGMAKPSAGLGGA